MKKTLILGLVGLSLGLSACGDNTGASLSSNPSAFNRERAEEVASKHNAALERFLTAELAGRISGHAAGEAEIEKGRDLGYRWESGRSTTIKVAGYTVDAPVPDVVKLSRFSAMDINTFQMAYRTPTEEEKSQAREAVQKRMSEAGVDGGLSGDLFDVLAERAQHEPVSDLGDAASWNPADNELAVLSDGLKFTVQVDVGDATRNREGAIALAKEILAEL